MNKCFEKPLEKPIERDCDHLYEQRIFTWEFNMETYLITDCVKCGDALECRILNE